MVDSDYIVIKYFPTSFGCFAEKMVHMHACTVKDKDINNAIPTEKKV